MRFPNVTLQSAKRYGWYEYQTGNQESALATEEICGMVDMIQTLIDKGFAYEKNGTVYYSTRKFKDYGKAFPQESG